MVVPLPGWNVARSTSHIKRMEMMQTGRATRNQTPQLGSGRIFWRAMIFWGEAMGEAAPPILEANAMPSMSAFEKLESDGKFLSRGWHNVSVWRLEKGLFELYLND